MDRCQQLAERMVARQTLPVERIDTHGAIVLLIGARAYKLKRPVRFSFLDFSTPDARLAALAHELELNRRTAPDIYRRLVPVAEDGSIGQEPAFEWALEMQRFDNAGRFDRLLERGALKPGLLDRLAHAIAMFHQRQPALQTPPLGSAMATVIAGNESDLWQSVGTVFEPRDVAVLLAATRTEFERHRTLLAQRQNWVRHCHGDLHSENIVVIDNVPVLFDCIEFNDDFARIDVLYDLAFLVMDMTERGHRDAAWRVMQTYLDDLLQDEGLALWPLYLSMRAAIRAKVEAFAGHADKARTYLKFAITALHPSRPRLIAIGGLSGTGKSTLGRAIAPPNWAFHLRSDVQRKQLFGVDPSERLPDAAYAEDVGRRVFEALNRRAAALLRANRSVIVDGVFAKPGERQAIADVAAAEGVPFDGIWLESDLATRIQRVGLRRGDASDADAQVARAQETYELGEITWQRLDASMDEDAVVRTAATMLGLG